jgi:murein DD-endopeptidase MepM/ murein hydrolase activator NlpD
MQDFKSYTLERSPARGQLVKRLIFVFVLLAILVAGFMFLLTKPANESQQEALPASESKDKPSNNERLIIPLPLPGQSNAHSEQQLPPSEKSSGGLIKETVAAETVPIVVTALEPLPAVEIAPKLLPPPPIVKDTHEVAYKIRSGDSLATIFKKHGLSANLLHRIIHSCETAKQLTNIKPGEMLYLRLDDDNNLSSLLLVHSKINSIEIVASNEGFQATVLRKQVEHRTAHLNGTIENSLFISAKKAGLSEKLIMQLADIFGWDIDFALEIRAGDRFTVIFQEDYLDGEKLRDGPILAAEFTNHGQTYQALRYVDDTGRADYYTPNGRSMRKAFLRAPVDFRRISSRFTKERWHPVLGKKRPHRGVDYAAKTGTPIKSAGDGKIIFRGKKGGYGNAVIIQHGQTYTTLYGHLSRFNKKTKRGARVKQGQVIGYVGMTGLATGPHLHYEFRVNGVHRNPLTVKLPAAQPIAKKYRTDFLMKVQPLVSQLELIKRTLVANAE